MGGNSGDVRERSLLTWRIAAIPVLLIGIGMLCGSAYAASEFSERRDELHALRDAPRCAAPPQRPADCTWTQEFLISDIQLYEGRNSGISAMLTTPNQGYKWPTAYRNDGPLLETLRDGDRVKGTIWRGDVVKIAARGAEQATLTSPYTMAETMLAMVVVLAVSGMLLVFGSGWRLVRWSGRAPTRGMNCVFGAAVGLLLGGLGAMAVAGGTAEESAPEVDTGALWLFAALYGAVAAVTVLAAALMYRAAARSR
ncbi:hypothetical protein E1264_15405 [Actinomadura sp. KC216]|uniref:hypothetical protein n=1 Tax=Actinomadura sp. KC216 TaxID=2530370 RepID=UPI00104E5472|nr:hypothetical protein [Actinomadura sp. KC216]TDB87175.1 hypothetical protein E1264_15405 [Actinomadura sp. KC216]